MTASEPAFLTHESVTLIAGHALRCYTLNTGERVIVESDVAAAFGGAAKQTPSADAEGGCCGC